MATLWGFESLPRHQYFSPFRSPGRRIHLALTATIHTFLIGLSDVDRAVYETLVTVGSPGAPGDFTLAFDLVREGFHWFSLCGVLPANRAVRVV